VTVSAEALARSAREAPAFLGKSAERGKLSPEKSDEMLSSMALTRMPREQQWG
jgi:hypothetical protein